MWLSKRTRTDGDAGSVGEVTLGGDGAAVLTDAEHRDLGLLLPGGYAWCPGEGSGVLVLKCGHDSAYIAGETGPRQDIRPEPGEVVIYAGAGGAEIRLLNDGTVSIKGRVHVEGGLVINGIEIA